MLKRYFYNFHIALTSLGANKLRSMLSGLGIIFGVGAVIAMLAIGTGARQELLEQMKLIGVNNIVVEAVVEGPERNGDDALDGQAAQQAKRFSPGLSLRDAQIIEQVLPSVARWSPEIVLEKTAIRKGKKMPVKIIGINPNFFDLNNLPLQEGSMFNDLQRIKGMPVCIIGHSIKGRLFSSESAVGKRIKCGNVWLEVIGVTGNKHITDRAQENLGIRNYNNDVYLPVETALLRFQNRGMLKPAPPKPAWEDDDEEDKKNEPPPNYHQIDRLTIQVAETDQLVPSKQVIHRLLMRRHNQVEDFRITVPQLLLEQQQRTENIFNLVLGAIAGISLLVGGIGIMNIMLASVMERIRTIGISRSLGATQNDIVSQFLFEAVLISLAGGLIGIALGVGLATAIASFGDIPTIVTPTSIILAFGVASAVGLIFGIFPARKAAQQDPIEALRHE